VTVQVSVFGAGQSRTTFVESLLHEREGGELFCVGKTSNPRRKAIWQTFNCDGRRDLAKALRIWFTQFERRSTRCDVTYRRSCAVVGCDYTTHSCSSAPRIAA